MKLTNNRYYFDFNASSPLSPRVIQWLREGDLFLANPSSHHTDGKLARKSIQQTEELIRSHFKVPSPDKYQVFFHSGATEGVNMMVRGCADYSAKHGHPLHYFYSGTDHSTAFTLGGRLREDGHFSYEIPVDSNGDYDDGELIGRMKMVRREFGEKAPILWNNLWVHNETGVVWDLERAMRVKQQTGCLLHVDAVQAIGKIADYSKLYLDDFASAPDVLTFSGHKFGAFKGVGFTIMKKGLPMRPLFVGGNQQMGTRSGTENPHGVQTLKLALEDIIEHFDPQVCKAARDHIEGQLLAAFAGKGEVIGLNAKKRNVTTTDFLFHQHPSEQITLRLDMNGIDVTSGSACSSGIPKPSRVLMKMGYNEDLAKRAVRFSFSPFLKKAEAVEYAQVLLKVLEPLR